MWKFINVKKSKTAGLPPGSLIHLGERKLEKVELSLMDYDQTSLNEMELEKIEDCLPFKDKPTVTWLDINGLHQTDIIEKVGQFFDLHPLIMEYILDTSQRPKMDDFGDYIYIVLSMIYSNDSESEIVTEQVSIILGQNFVISFQEAEGDVFNPVRERIRTGHGRLRKMGPDYLAYALLDAVVDNYFSVLEKTGERIEYLEEEVVGKASTDTLREIHDLKRNLIFLRKSIWPLREMINNILRCESSLFTKTTCVYLKDVYDHTIQIIDSVETFRDMVSGLLDIYLSSVSNRMNEVMKVLTIIATIFIPLTFIAGIYGMNFEKMPELKWPWGYPLVWFVMIVVGCVMVFFFKRKKWI